MKNILILGANGFIGQNIVERLLTNNDNMLTLLVRDISKVCESINNHKSVTIVEGDVKDIMLIKKTLMIYKIDVVIHLISELIPSSNLEDFNKELNHVIIPTYTLLEYLSESNIKIIFFSSGGTVYGNVKDNKIQENHTLKPINYYGNSKLMIENYIQFLNRTKNLSFLILRPSNVYGKYQRIEAKQGFIAVAIGKILFGSPIEVWGDGETIRDYIDVNDVALLTSKIVNSDINNEILNIGSGEGRSLNEIIEYFEHILDRKIDVIYKDSRKIDVDKIVLEIQKVKSYIDYTPRDIEVGIKDFLESLEVKYEK